MKMKKINENGKNRMGSSHSHTHTLTHTHRIVFVLCRIKNLWTDKYIWLKLLLNGKTKIIVANLKRRLLFRKKQPKPKTKKTV